MSEKPRAKAYVYTRVSTAMQVDGFSLDAQRDEIRRFAELKKIDIVGEYCDEGKSGKNTKNRTEFNRMLADIKRKKDDVRYVLVSSCPDSPEMLRTLWRTCEQCRIAVLTCSALRMAWTALRPLENS